MGSLAVCRRRRRHGGRRGAQTLPGLPDQI